MTAGTDNARELVGVWLDAAQRAEVRDAIVGVHAGIAREVAACGPVCAQSGRCCRFQEYGHRLYVTGLEAAVTLLGAGLVGAGGAALDSGGGTVSLPLLRVHDGRDARPTTVFFDTPEPGRPRPGPCGGSDKFGTDRLGDAPARGEDGRDARPRGGGAGDACPLMVGRSCGAHAHRPAGCRTFYCDAGWAAVMAGVSERAVAGVREIHDRFGVPYRYMEWRGLLAWFGVAGG